MARRARTASAILGPGDSNLTEKRRSLWALPWVPSPSRKRPPEAFWRSQAIMAVIMGLREKTVAMLVPSLIVDVTVAATASGREGAGWGCGGQRTAEPPGSP